MSDVGRSPELMNNNSVTSSHRTAVDEVVARQATFEGIEYNRDWQHGLKTPKDEIQRILLFGSREECSTVKNGCVKIRCRIKLCILERSAE